MDIVMTIAGSDSGGGADPADFHKRENRGPAVSAIHLSHDRASGGLSSLDKPRQRGVEYGSACRSLVGNTYLIFLFSPRFAGRE